MKFWQSSGVVDFLLLCALLLCTRAVLRQIPGYRKLAIPDVMVAGTIGLVLGESALGWLPISGDTLEQIVYHGLALVFLTLGLQAPKRGQGAAGARSAAFALPFVNVAQATLGLTIVLAWTALSGDLHPGYGLLLPLGFAQGPGQALSLGTAWEEMGLKDGGQVGLAIASAGYATCVIIGVALFHWGRHRGWAEPSPEPHPQGLTDPTHPAPPLPERGDLEPLTRQIVFVGGLYLVTYGILAMLAGALANKPQLAAMIWGFHFLVALGLAVGIRAALRRYDGARGIDDAVLSRLTGLTVDLTAVAAIAAVRVDVVAQHLGPILLLSVAGAAMTAAMCVWLGRRAFPEQPFGHTLVLFGAMTGTLPTGLALLRLHDPELRGPASRSMVIGTTGAIVFAIPLLLIILPMPVLGWPETFPAATWKALGLLVAYGLLIITLWWRFGGLKLRGNGWSWWPGGAAKR